MLTKTSSLTSALKLGGALRFLHVEAQELFIKDLRIHLRFRSFSLLPTLALLPFLVLVLILYLPRIRIRFLGLVLFSSASASLTLSLRPLRVRS
jgi:hypothetical protein